MMIDTVMIDTVIIETVMIEVMKKDTISVHITLKRHKG